MLSHGRFERVFLIWILPLAGGLFAVGLLTAHFFKGGWPMWAGLVLCFLGICLLLGSLVIDEVLFKRLKHGPLDLARMAREEVDLGEIQLPSGKLIVTEDWFRWKKKRRKNRFVEINPVPSSGCHVFLVKATGPGISFASDLCIRNATVEEPVRRNRSRISVDSGTLLFVDSEYLQAKLDPKELEMRLAGAFRNKEDNPVEPVCMLMSDSDGLVKGVIVETGLGDGDYSVHVGRGTGDKTEIVCRFIGRSLH